MVLESNQIPKGTFRLAGGPYLHQGLSSIVLITGLEPITSDVSGRLSNQLIYMSVFVGEEGLEPVTCSLQYYRYYHLR